MANNYQGIATDTIVIDGRFNGPPDSGNGGYVSGLIGARIDGAAEVTIRVPPPLDRPLRLTHGDDGVRLIDGETLVAHGTPAEFELNVPPAPTFAAAEAAVAGYSGFVDHTFATCFVCGPKRAERDGLRIFAGPIDRPAMVAAPWVPDAGLALDGTIPEEILWAAMDCPGAFAIMDRDVPLVLGRMAAQILRLVQAEERHIVLGWALGHDGRKHYAGTALFDESGELVAKAFQTWIELKH